MSLFTPGLFTAVAILVLIIFFFSAALRILKEYRYEESTCIISFNRTSYPEKIYVIISI
jgi:hypothetical protein